MKLTNLQNKSLREHCGRSNGGGRCRCCDGGGVVSHGEVSNTEMGNTALAMWYLCVLTYSPYTGPRGVPSWCLGSALRCCDILSFPAATMRFLSPARPSSCLHHAACDAERNPARNTALKHCAYCCVHCCMHAAHATPHAALQAKAHTSSHADPVHTAPALLLLRRCTGRCMQLRR